MRIDVLSLFPDFVDSFLNWSIISRANKEGIVEFGNINIRDFSNNKHKKVDDYPYGGGPGMLMTPQPIFDAIESIKEENSRVIYLSPQGKKLDQELAISLAKEEHLILLSGHYEGVDNRVIENLVDLEISIGDYVLTGGELPAMVLIDSIVRLLPGVLSSKESFEDESHYKGLLEYPQYTRPEIFKGLRVPETLMSGNHKKIAQWRRMKSIEATYIKRPDILKNIELSSSDRKLLKKIKDCK